MLRTILLLLLWSAATGLSAQTYGEDLTVPLEAIVSDAGPSLTLTWPPNAAAVTWEVYQKATTTTAWTSLADLPAADTSFTITGITYGTPMDYRVIMVSLSGANAYGYLRGGMDIALPEDAGAVIIVADITYMSEPDYVAAYTRFIDDLKRDGWYTAEIFVSPADPVYEVKAQIQTVYDMAPDRYSHVVLLGHVPVPYSGDIYPDGHPDHEGAWPSDLYYGDMDVEWTDATVDVLVAADPRNQNVPGDGKFDQSYIPGAVELAVGRIDMYNLPAFAEGEKALMLQYFDKLHRFKTGELRTDNRALVDDNFGGYSEGFSQNGYRNFAPLVGRNNTIQGDYLLDASYSNPSGITYLWSYGCGGGWYQGAGGVATTDNFAADSLSTIFTMLFGSYFGDWDVSNAFGRAVLAQGNTLTNCWAGRPNWHFYPMASGATIGACALLSQNNTNTFFGSTIFGLNKIVSTNFLGEPTLRMYYPKPPSEATYDGIEYPENPNGTLYWLSPPELVDGYNVYVKNISEDALVTEWQKLNAELIGEVSYNTDVTTLPETGIYVLAVKAVKQLETPSGTWYAESLAAMDTIDVVYPGINNLATATVMVSPNPTAGNLFVDMPIYGSASYVVLDMKGAVVLSGNMQQNSPLNMSALPSGTYQLLITSENKSYQAQFVKE
jgi:hypothetical protein